MPKPLKALYYGQLEFKTAGSAVPTSGHEVFRVTFYDADGEKKTGYFKPLGAEYPSLLAMISVAYSILLRMACGTQVAADRIVLDDKTGDIVGSLSYELPDFKPLLCFGESLPDNVQERELRCPSEETLLQYNFAEMLVAEYRSGNNDAHPGNFGIARKDEEDKESPFVPAIIDHDMRGYNKLTSIIKGPRLSAGITEETPASVVMTSNDLNTFPMISGRTHWPANTIPGNLYMPKRYMAYSQFQGLAKNPVLQTETGNISFQEQLFNALLKQLVLFNPKTLKLWLTEYLGDLTLDFMKLEISKCEQLSRFHPGLLNMQTNPEPFVDFIMAYFQQEYDEFYSTIVFYPGCEKNASGVPVISLNQYLQNKPSALQNIIGWATEQNAKMERAWNKFDFPKYQEDLNKYYEEVSKHPQIVIEYGLNSEEDNLFKLKLKSLIPPSPGWYCIPPENRYDIDKLVQIYHQIWRDSNIFMIQEVIFSSRSLAKKIPANPSVLRLSKQAEHTPDTLSLTSAWQLIEKIDDEELLTTDSPADSSQILKCFIRDLRNCSQAYYFLTRDTLQIEDNFTFIDAVSKLIREYESKIYQSLSQEMGREFAKIVKSLEQCYGRMHFQRHLKEDDVELTIKDKHDYSAVLQRKHTEPDVMTAALKTLFHWAKKIPMETLEGAILEIITIHYEPVALNLTAKRSRSRDVIHYLKVSMESGDNKLAFILSSGGSESTSLNTMLIKHLLPIVLKDAIAVVDINLMSVSQAFERNEFNELFYTEHAIKYAKSDHKFTHLYSWSSALRFNNILYHWVNCVSPVSFKDLVIKVLHSYEPYSFNFFTKKIRGPEVRAFLEQGLTNQQILAYIFSGGDTLANSLNTLLFKKLVDTMCLSIASSKQARDNPDFLWILDIGFTNDCHFNHFLGTLQSHAKDKSNALSVKPELTGSERISNHS